MKREIPNEFFENEVREGYYVPTMMKRCWAAQLSILEKIERICSKYNIRYYGAYGTMIGAVRHHGFIPWDDDMDLFMFRNDFEKFRLVLSKELPQAYGYADDRSTAGEFCGHMTICNMDNHAIDAEVLRDAHGFFFQAGIDVFPLDYLPRGEEAQKEYCNLITLISTLIANYDTLPDIEQKEVVRGLENNYNVHFNDHESIKKQLSTLLEAVRSMYSSNESDSLIAIGNWYKNKSIQFPKEDFANTLYLPFENTIIPIPAGYDQMLTVEYGDWRTPVRGGAEHSYPYYDKHMARLNDAGLKHLFYHYDYGQREIIKKRREEKNFINKDSLKILFLTTDISKWMYVEQLYNAAKKIDNVDISVVAIPFYQLSGLEKFGYDSLGYVQCNKNQFENIDELRDFYEVNPSEYMADIIITTEGYDGWNSSIEVPDMWKVRSLMENCRKLIYVQPFSVEEFGEDDFPANRIAEDYAYIPGVMLADTVIVQSETLKRAYVSAIKRKTDAELAETIKSKIVTLEQYLKNERSFT